MEETGETKTEIQLGGVDAAAAALAASAAELEAARTQLAAANAERDAALATASAAATEAETSVSVATAAAAAATARAIEAQRRALIAENRGQIVDELVGGDTAEALEASVEVAKAAYTRALETARSQLAASTVPAGASGRDTTPAPEMSALERVAKGLTGRNGSR